VLQSVSRLTTEIQDDVARSAAQEVRALLAAYRDKRDLIAIGAYQPGSDPRTDAAIAAQPSLEAFLRQSVTELSSAEDARELLVGLAGSGPAGPPLDALLADAASASLVDPNAVAAPSAIPPLNLGV
jgi:flagellum-specific ATP synthase